MSDLSGWTPPPAPSREVLEGHYATLEPVGPEHADGLFEASAEDASGEMWRYLPDAPRDLGAWKVFCTAAQAAKDPMHFAVRMADGRLGGTLALMSIVPDHGVIEIGWISFAPRLQRTRESSEAVILLARHAFRLGYRRLEWKCDAANMPSRRAAERYGLSYEGVFRNHRVVKGRNRDSAWFAATDSEWPALRAAWETWLDPLNFAEDGSQKQRLGALTAPVLVAKDPGT